VDKLRDLVRTLSSERDHWKNQCDHWRAHFEKVTSLSPTGNNNSVAAANNNNTAALSAGEKRH